MHTADTFDPLNLSEPFSTTRYASQRLVREDHCWTTLSVQRPGLLLCLQFVCSRPHPKNTTQEPLKMDPLLNEEDLQSAEEEEEVDPRIQVRISFPPG